MKIIYQFYSENPFEWEGMFDEKGKLLDYWSCSDANWKSEYFDGFMTKLGIQILPLPEKFRKKAVEQVRKHCH